MQIAAKGAKEQQWRKRTAGWRPPFIEPCGMRPQGHKLMEKNDAKS
jgi:hypothetical protein